MAALPRALTGRRRVLAQEQLEEVVVVREGRDVVHRAALGVGVVRVRAWGDVRLSLSQDSATTLYQVSYHIQ
jgi:hypothetical protein